MEKQFKNQSIQSEADQLVRYYKVNTRLSKKDALNVVLSKIENGEKSSENRKRNIGIRFIGLSAAATVAVLIMFYFFTATVAFNGVDGQVTTVRLPDRSRVVLHNSGEISYSKYFWNRKLKLVGEAYFEVEKGSRFLVKTNLGSVQVLGTRFLVSDQNGKMLVQCFEGKVKTNIDDQSFLLTAGMQVAENSGDNQVQSTEFAGGYPEFAKFRKSFVNCPLDKVTADLQNFFGVQILVNDSANRYFSGSIETGDLNNALEIVTGSMQLSFKENSKNQIVIK